MILQFEITVENVAAIDRAIHVLRDRIQSRGLQTEASRLEELEALAGLLSIFPKPFADVRQIRGPNGAA